MPANQEVADIFRRDGDAYRRANDGHLNRIERRVMSAIELCRTAALGGHTEVCSDCGLIRRAYNSCLMGKNSNGESAAAFLGFMLYQSEKLLTRKGFPICLECESICPCSIRGVFHGCGSCFTGGYERL